MKRKQFLLLLILFILIIPIAIYQTTKPIKIALVADFYEDKKGFETSSNIAANIVEDYINNNSGIYGKKINIIPINTDFNNCEEVFEKINDEGIESIVTTANSENLHKLKSFADKEHILTIDVSSTATSLSQIDDYIYRVFPDDSREVGTLIKYLEQQEIGKDIAIIGDKYNKAFIDSIVKELEKNKFNIILKDTLSDKSVNYEPIDVQAMKQANAIIILSSSKDSGFLIQNIRNKGIDSSIFAFSWSADYTLISYGGDKTEGIKIVSPIAFNSNNQEYTEYTEKLNAYNKKDGLLTNGVFRAFMILRDTYEYKLKNNMSLKDSIESIEEFKVFGEKMVFNEYGDCIGDSYILVVNNGELIKQEEE